MDLHVVFADPALQDLTTLQCAEEPIHVPGSIQPHGAMLAVAEDSGLITHASANLSTILGRRVEDVLGKPLDSAIDEAVCKVLLTADVAGHRVHAITTTEGATLVLSAHRSGASICIDIEPAAVGPSKRLSTVMAQSVVETLRQAATGLDVCALAVRGLQEITGYDRVMAYRFGADGHGEVIAEVCASHMEPYLGLRYPASDIPAQARQQYLRQRVGSIADSRYAPIPLMTAAAAIDAPPLDLTHSVLRSVSPVHRQYMRNMNTAASLTVGLAEDSRLWGMLVCHHGSPRIAGPQLRAAAGMIGEVVSLLLGSLAEAEMQVQRLSRSSLLQALAGQLAGPLPLAHALVASQADLLGLVGATGAMVRVAGERFCVGRTPPPDAALRALDALLALASDRPLAIDAVGARLPGLADCRDEGSGALLLPLGSSANDGVPDDAILWFRPEIARTVTWGGDPSQHATADPASGRLSPRTSFAAWKEIVGGHAAPWSRADLALAGELGDVVREEVAKRTKAALLESEERFQLLAEHSGVVVTLNDLNDIRRYVSPAAEGVLGWRPEDMVGRSAMELVHPDDRQALIDAHTALLAGASSRSDCYRYLQPDGSWLWIEGHARLRAGGDGSVPTDYVVVLRDATERKEADLKLGDMMERMKRMAMIDGLTGIANRRHFDEVAEKEWRRCEREELPISLLLLDADHFKLFNDRYGHLAGDACLRAIAVQLESMAQRPTDLSARYGGEEFLLLLPNTALDGALRVAERIRVLVRDLRIAHEGGSDDATVTVSIGVACTHPGRPDALKDVHTLLSKADAALYRAKGSGRDRVVAAQIDNEPVDRQSGGHAASTAGASSQDTLADAAVDAVDAEPGPASADSIEADTAHEALVQFLYRAPIGLVQTALDGTVEMINPMSASLLMPLSSNGDLDNLFVALGTAEPRLRQWVDDFKLPSGTVCESVRVSLPLGALPGAVTQILSISVSKLDETRLMAMVSDITVEVEREQSGLALHLDAAARTDTLTQLPNRTVVRDQIERAIARGRADTSYQFAVLFMNCDRFKQINDTLGHAAGDVVLGLMAGRLQSTLRQRNRSGSETMVGRLGGDEFAVLLDDLRSADEVHEVAQRLLEVLSQPYGVQSHQLHFSVSMGVVLCAQAAADADAVLQDSSIAMVEAKRAGGARYVIFEPAMHERALHQGGIESDLRRALLENELFVVYQPVVALRPDTKTTVEADPAPTRSAGVEALVRWRHPTRGIVPPVEFIGVAEHCGLIGPLGAFVLATACAQFMVWHRSLGPLAPRLLAVNLSRGQLIEPGFVDHVRQTLESSGMPPERLQLEVTESLAAQDESIRARLHELKALGLTLALDDFGTGYSSLASLHQLPVDTVKIDRSFVSEAASSTYHRVLIEATIRVAGSLNMSTVAEGIETEAQATLLGDLGCEKGQGYLFSKPLAAEDLARWLVAQPA